MRTGASRMQASPGATRARVSRKCGLDPAQGPRRIARMALPQNPIVKLVSRFAAKLRFPTSS